MKISTGKLEEFQENVEKAKSSIKEVKDKFSEDAKKKKMKEKLRAKDISTNADISKLLL
jgi:hypothetical protein